MVFSLSISYEISFHHIMEGNFISYGMASDAQSVGGLKSWCIDKLNFEIKDCLLPANNATLDRKIFYSVYDSLSDEWLPHYVEFSLCGSRNANPKITGNW